MRLDSYRSSPGSREPTLDLTRQTEAMRFWRVASIRRLPMIAARRTSAQRRSGVRLWRVVAALGAVVLIAGCATRRPAPIEDRAGVPAPPPPIVAPTPSPAPAPAAETPPPTYTVKRGDTLYQIALDNGLDYRELAAWNAIDNVNLIRVGQVLRLTAPGETAPATSPSGVTTAPLRTGPPVTEPKAPGGVAVPAAPSAAAAGTANLKSAPKAVKEPYSEHAVRELTLAAATPTQSAAMSDAMPAPLPLRPEAPVDTTRMTGPSSDGDDHLDWTWPAKGKVVTGFSDTANLKGIDISGKAGDPVLASAAGKVVYAGSGLRGYGKLIIIKHNKTYLSAYAHNREILVKEGQQVAQGQKIAEMGNTDADQVKLHFEIRRLGKPMDPARYLPPA
jgi:lipoprotein NlpD